MNDQEFIEVQKLLRELMEDAHLVMVDGHFMKAVNHPYNLGITAEVALIWAMKRRLAKERAEAAAEGAMLAWKLGPREDRR